MPTQPPDKPTQKIAAPTVPDHELLTLVGHGSYGEVWLARSLTGTYRAVKVVSRKAFAQERPYEREFEGIQKFEPISRTHPGLVSILHVGRNPTGEYFYYVMEVADDLVRGQEIDPAQYRPRTLSNLLAQHAALPLEQCLRIGLSLASGLDHLHRHGLIHRDIKPSNIIFVGQSPKFADIGLVTDIGQKITFVGTEGYIPPEGPGSPTADLYALGKVLYEISTGLDRLQFPALPDAFRHAPEAGPLMQLNELLLKACEAQPKQRFQSAAQFRATLQSLLRRCATPAPPAPWPPKGGGRRTLQITVLKASSTERNTELETRLAHWLEDQWTALGHEVFVDEPTGLNLDWARMMEAQIEASDAVIALLSPASLGNEHLAYALEITHQTSQGTSRGLKFLPVAVGLTFPLPRGMQLALGSHRLLVWDNPQHDQRLMEELTRALLGKTGSALR